MNKEIYKRVEGKLHNYKYLQIKLDNLELDIQKIENDYRGCGAISYGERSGVTFNISRNVENEVISKESKLEPLIKEFNDKDTEKSKIENALKSLDETEMKFFNLFYNSFNKNNMKYISMKMHIDRSTCYSIRERIVEKIDKILFNNK